MKALIYRRFGDADVLEWTDQWPAPEVSPHSVLIKPVAGSINPKDVLLRKGKFSKTLARDALPRVAGLDVAGHVAAVGSQVTAFTEGDAVFGMTNHFAGGVHAELAKLQADEIAHAPGSIALEQAASVPLAAQTALQALRDCAALQPGQRVLINGASGGVGHFAVQIAKALGAEVHATCGPNNVNFVLSLGADTVHDYKNQPATQLADQYHCIFDVFGKECRSSLAKQLTAKGIYVSTVPKAQTIAGEALAWLGFSQRSRLVAVRSNTSDLTQLSQWIETGTIRPQVERVYPVEEAANAHRHVESKHTVGKVCIAF